MAKDNNTTRDEIGTPQYAESTAHELVFFHLRAASPLNFCDVIVKSVITILQKRHWTTQETRNKGKTPGSTQTMQIMNR